MGGKASRRKGHDFERKVAKLFRESGFPEAHRGQQTRSGSAAPDVDGTPFWIECKKGKKISIPKAIRQAQEATDGRQIVVVFQSDYQPIYAAWMGPDEGIEVALFHDWVASAILRQHFVYL